MLCFGSGVSYRRLIWVYYTVDKLKEPPPDSIVNYDGPVIAVSSELRLRVLRHSSRSLGASKYCEVSILRGFRQLQATIWELCCYGTGGTDGFELRLGQGLGFRL